MEFFTFWYPGLKKSGARTKSQGTWELQRHNIYCVLFFKLGFETDFCLILDFLQWEKPGDIFKQNQV